MSIRDAENDYDDHYDPDASTMLTVYHYENFERARPALARLFYEPDFAPGIGL